jgi:hypothetical protein
MTRQRLRFKLTSESPLLLHNGQTADPLNRFAKQLKQVNSKRGKTDADFEEVARIEWFASLYLHEKRVCLPSEVLEAGLIGGARKLKLGKQAQAGLYATHHAILEFDGCELSPEQLWERDQNRFTVGVKIGMNKVMRTRFRVDTWSTSVELLFDDGLLNKAQVLELVRITGEQIGLCDWRPKFGRFVSEPLG